ncbi:hypothetical protein J2S46_002344 [Kitasatospora herbaricolor]|uniref:chromosome partitioning protein n=1 Tax=Kitasatospora herbaricolor TaxID=68217 RepID=UPI00174D9E9E|nr:chromosome partitioning protein [Kitasatospora herbaricolor]MDQ0307788.1 hypothetical protein [Kitasatospora herbaricolor]
MTDEEIAVGWLFAWVAGGGRPGGDHGAGAAMARVHEVVSGRLGSETALLRLREEAEAGQPAVSDATRTWLALVLRDAVGRDPVFAAALRRALADVREEGRQTPPAGYSVAGNVIHGPAAVQVGPNGFQVNNFGRPR